MQFFKRFQRLSLTFGLGGMVLRLLASVGTISPLRKLAVGPEGIYDTKEEIVYMTVYK